MSGWSMSHGGLLPEEVIVPFLEWFGKEEFMSWPTVSFPDGIVVDQNRLIVTVALNNAHNRATQQGSLTIAISSEDARTTKQLPSLAAGASTLLKLQFAVARPPQGDKLPVDVIMQARQTRSGEPLERVEQFLVARAKQLVEKTREQADFENMF